MKKQTFFFKSDTDNFRNSIIIMFRFLYFAFFSNWFSSSDLQNSEYYTIKLGQALEYPEHFIEYEK